MTQRAANWGWDFFWGGWRCFSSNFLEGGGCFFLEELASQKFGDEKIATKKIEKFNGN